MRPRLAAADRGPRRRSTDREARRPRAASRRARGGMPQNSWRALSDDGTRGARKMRRGPASRDGAAGKPARSSEGAPPALTTTSPRASPRTAPRTSASALRRRRAPPRSSRLGGATDGPPQERSRRRARRSERRRGVFFLSDFSSIAFPLCFKGCGARTYASSGKEGVRRSQDHRAYPQPRDIQGRLSSSRGYCRAS